MVTFVCPECGRTVPPAAAVCPRCGFDLAAFEAAPYGDKLLVALWHPEPDTAERAAHILGIVKPAGAADALERRYRATSDPYLQREIVRALARLGGPAAERVLTDARAHRSVIVRSGADGADRPAPRRPGVTPPGARGE